MQKVLRKRILRDLKENCFRYLALGALIVLCMYLIISLIGTADTIIIGSDNAAEKNKLEDGQFTLFVPLTEAEKAELTNQGITLEEQFYLDYELEDGSTLRVFQNREQINLLEAVEGSHPKSETEVVLERRYAEEHSLESGNKITIGEKEFTVSGIGCTPDYDAPYKDFTDSSVNSSSFGTAFVTKEAYEILLSEKNSIKAEEYVYSYLLSGELTDEELKEELKEFKVNAEEIDDIYFREYWEEQTAEKTELEDGITKLSDGSKELYDGLNELSEIQTGLAPLDE